MMQAVAFVLVGTFVWIMYYMVIGLAYLLWYTALGIGWLCVWTYKAMTGSDNAGKAS